eukprot:386723-Pelagomonas_calceolata.AAC.2
MIKCSINNANASDACLGDRVSQHALRPLHTNLCTHTLMSMKTGPLNGFAQRAELLHTNSCMRTLMYLQNKPSQRFSASLPRALSFHADRLDPDSSGLWDSAGANSCIWDGGKDVWMLKAWPLGSLPILKCTHRYLRSHVEVSVKQNLYNTHTQHRSTSIKGLELGALVGSGSFGTVYAADW